MPVPHALTRPDPQEEREALDNPYSEGFDMAFVILRRDAVEQTLKEMFVTYAASIRTTAARLGLPPHGLTVGHVARAYVGRPAIDPGVKHDLHVTKPIMDCNTQSSADNTKVSEHVEHTATEKGHTLGKTLLHKHCDGAAFKLAVTEKVCSSPRCTLPRCPPPARRRRFRNCVGVPRREPKLPPWSQEGS